MLHTENYEKILEIYKNDIIYGENQDVIQTPINYLTDKLLLWFNDFEPLQLNNLNKLLSIKYWKILE